MKVDKQRYLANISFEKKRLEFQHPQLITHAFYITFDFIRETPDEVLYQLLKDREDQEDKILSEKVLTSD